MLPFQALKVSLCMWKCTRTLPFTNTWEFWDTDYTLWQTVRNREVSHWPAAVSDPSFPSRAHPLRTQACARGAYQKCVLNQCFSVVWKSSVNSSPSYKGEIIFFHAHLTLSLALCSLSLPLSVLLPGDFVINSTQLSGTLCPGFPLTVTPFSLNLHLEQSASFHLSAQKSFLAPYQTTKQKWGKVVKDFSTKKTVCTGFGYYSVIHIVPLICLVWSLNGYINY